MRNIRTSLFPLLLLILLISFAADSAFGDSKPKPRERDSTTRLDVSVRRGSRQPISPTLQEAIRKFMEEDKSASFNYYLGHVNNFSSRPKLTVPQYAAKILRDHGLSTNAQVIEKSLYRTKSQNSG